MNENTYVNSEMSRIMSVFPDMDVVAAEIFHTALREAYAAGERYGRQRQIQRMQDWASREGGPLILDEGWRAFTSGPR